MQQARKEGATSQVGISKDPRISNGKTGKLKMRGKDVRSYGGCQCEVVRTAMSHESSRAAGDDELPRSRRQLVMCGELRTVRPRTFTCPCTALSDVMLLLMNSGVSYDSRQSHIPSCPGSPYMAPPNHA